MENVWKVGSRWSDKGTPDSSIISIFRRNSIVFVGEDTARERFQNEVKVGDYFAIADGYKVDFPNQRPFILMRAGYSGSQRFGMIPWSGDVNRTWGGLSCSESSLLQSFMDMGFAK